MIGARARWGGAAVVAEGPYRLYVETGFIPFDDYAFDGRFLLLGSVCNVEAPSGCLQVTEARGKFSATDLYHVVACDDDADTVYLRHVLSRIPAAKHADMRAYRGSREQSATYFRAVA